jgi:hypothetical protein
MTILTLDEHQRMSLAIQIADAAVSLDWLSSSFLFPIVSGPDRAKAKEQVKNLHDIAELLAGSRVLEIYGPDIEEEPVRKTFGPAPA